jgi:hypothetical protein
MGFIVSSWHDNLICWRVICAEFMSVGDSDKFKAMALPLNLVA